VVHLVDVGDVAPIVVAVGSVVSMRIKAEDEYGDNAGNDKRDNHTGD